MKTITTLLICTPLLFGQAAVAGPVTDELSTCLADNTSGKDRKDLARWIFLAMSSHPEIRNLSAATAATRDDADKKMAALVTRLLAVNCEKQTKAVAMNEGNAGMFIAFKSLGEVAMRELMGNPEVMSSVGSYAKHVDQQRMESVFGKSK